jgi:hypothetical protein
MALPADFPVAEVVGDVLVPVPVLEAVPEGVADGVVAADPLPLTPLTESYG